MLADLLAAGEPEVLEQFDGGAVEEPALSLATIGHLGNGFDEATTGASDLLDGAAERRSGYPWLRCLVST